MQEWDMLNALSPNGNSIVTGNRTNELISAAKRLYIWHTDKLVI